jgi:hypothetical protein
MAFNRQRTTILFQAGPIPAQDSVKRTGEVGIDFTLQRARVVADLAISGLSTGRKRVYGEQSHSAPLLRCPSAH